MIVIAGSVPVKQSAHMAEFQKSLPGLLAGAPAFRRYEVASVSPM